MSKRTFAWVMWGCLVAIAITFGCGAGRGPEVAEEFDLRDHHYLVVKGIGYPVAIHDPDCRGIHR